MNPAGLFVDSRSSDEFLGLGFGRHSEEQGHENTQVPRPVEGPEGRGGRSVGGARTVGGTGEGLDEFLKCFLEVHLLPAELWDRTHQPQNGSISLLIKSFILKFSYCF